MERRESNPHLQDQSLRYLPLYDAPINETITYLVMSFCIKLFLVFDEKKVRYDEKHQPRRDDDAERNEMLHHSSSSQQQSSLSKPHPSHVHFGQSPSSLRAASQL
jgi:hypothetical protein